MHNTACTKMTKLPAFLASNLKLARSLWPRQIQRRNQQQLYELLREHGFSIAGGDLKLLNGHWYVTHTGLLRLAQRRRCVGIHARPLLRFSDVASSRWAFKATVFKSHRCKGFVGYGDADPSNVSALVRGAEMRVAETRAVNRALRKAYGIGICSVEEIGNSESQYKAERQQVPANGAGAVGYSPSLRDRLSLLIRRHRLDPVLVKRYATRYCGTSELREASREQIQSLVDHLARYAESDLPGLLKQLNQGVSTQESAA